MTLPLRAVLAALLIAPHAMAMQPVPEVSAEAAIVVNGADGRVLWERNADQRMFPASLTKMMTAALAISDGDLGRTVTISQVAADVGESGIYLEKGEQLTLRELVRATLIWSANDAATAVAQAVGGSVDAFVDRMNRQAREWGATHTHFANPHGLHNDAHYTTARDLATIAVHAMALPRFREIVATPQMTLQRPEYVEPETPEDEALLEPGADKIRKIVTRTFYNRNRLIRHWAPCDGIKTGYTRQAGRCLAASATIDGWRAIAVVLKSKDSQNDAKALLQWTFRNWQVREVVKKGQRGWTVPVRDGREAKVGLQTTQGARILLPKSRDFELSPRVEAVTAPVAAGQPLGALDVLVGGKVRATVELAATADVSLSLWGAIKRYSLPSGLEEILLCMAAGVMLLGAATKAVVSRRGGFPAGK